MADVSAETHPAPHTSCRADLDRKTAALRYRYRDVPCMFVRSLPISTVLAMAANAALAAPLESSCRAIQRYNAGRPFEARFDQARNGRRRAFWDVPGLGTGRKASW